MVAMRSTEGTFSTSTIEADWLENNFSPDGELIAPNAYGLPSTGDRSIQYLQSPSSTSYGLDLIFDLFDGRTVRTTPIRFGCLAPTQVEDLAIKTVWPPTMTGTYSAGSNTYACLSSHEFRRNALAKLSNYGALLDASAKSAYQTCYLTYFDPVHAPTIARARKSNRERVKARFRLLRRLPANHDAAGAEAPKAESIDSAIAFVGTVERFPAPFYATVDDDGLAVIEMENKDTGFFADVTFGVRGEVECYKREPGMQSVHFEGTLDTEQTRRFLEQIGIVI